MKDAHGVAVGIFAFSERTHAAPPVMSLEMRGTTPAIVIKGYHRFGGRVKCQDASDIGRLSAIWRIFILLTTFIKFLSTHNFTDH